MKGTIATYVRHRGFGFLTSDADVHLLVFFHVSAWIPAQVPEIGAAVSYDLVESSKGPQAMRVTLEPAKVAEKATATAEVK